MNEFRHEVEIHLNFNHPNIVKMVGICINPMCMILEVDYSPELESNRLAFTKWKRNGVDSRLQQGLKLGHKTQNRDGCSSRPTIHAQYVFD